MTSSPSRQPEILERVDWLPISSPAGFNMGWVRASHVVRVNPNSGQRTIEFYNHRGEIEVACRAYEFDDEEFMRRLGLPAALHGGE